MPRVYTELRPYMYVYIYLLSFEEFWNPGPCFFKIVENVILYIMLPRLRCSLKNLLFRLPMFGKVC